MINSTKECIAQCPESISLYSYKYTYVNFTELEYDSKLENQYTLTQKNPKMYTLGKICFEEWQQGRGRQIVISGGEKVSVSI